MYKVNKIIILLLSICLTSIVKAADLIDVYKRAIEYNTEIKYSNMDYKIAGEKYKQTRSSAYPDISLTAQTKKINIEKLRSSTAVDDYTLDSYSINLTQPIFHLDLFDELEKSENYIKKSSIKKLNTKKEIILDTTILYFELIKNKNLLKASKIKNKLLKEKLSNAHILFSKGYITNIELNKFINDYNLSEIDVEMYNNQLISAKQDIHIFSGKEINDVHYLNLDINLEKQKYNRQEIVNLAMQNEENIKMALYDVRISREDLASNKSQHYPTIDVVASYDFSESSSGARFGGSSQESTEVGIVLNFPIFQGGYVSSQIKESRYEYEKAQYALDYIKKDVQKKIINDYNKNILLQNLIMTNRDNYNLSKENLSAVQAGYKFGVYSDVEVLEAEYNLAQSRLNLEKSILDYIITDLRLKKYTAELNANHIEKINKWLIW
ncbi:MAG: hypothetical protein CMD65_01845 [Gammaproteobacteria bacterium]|nr:hypothetical protein [Gammaproteobacteria bacterium]|tara:strand:+ start:5635 stop:6948 length:1314 start_codon:yes stop_codon:yes gene_type:complete